ncbi:TPA: hypothetical protein ACKFRA_003656, partial [Citrobacter koseri]
MTTENFSSAQKCVDDHALPDADAGLQNKKPRRSEVFISVMRLVAAKHTVLYQHQKYTRSAKNTQF